MSKTESEMKKEKKAEEEEQTELVTLEYNASDNFWLFLSFLFFGMTAIVFKEI